MKLNAKCCNKRDLHYARAQCMVQGGIRSVRGWQRGGTPLPSLNPSLDKWEFMIQRVMVFGGLWLFGALDRFQFTAAGLRAIVGEKWTETIPAPRGMSEVDNFMISGAGCGDGSRRSGLAPGHVRWHFPVAGHFRASHDSAGFPWPPSRSP